MKHAATMFGAACRFRDTKGLVEPDPGIVPVGETFTTIEVDQISTLHPRIVAFDNLPGAAEVYGYQAGLDFAVLVGNERRGLSYECVKAATDKVQVPMFSRRINCLNVAAASAVALYYLCGTRVGSMAVRGEPGNRRPEVLLLSPGTHVEVGSTIRSTAGLVATVPSVRKAVRPRVEAETRFSASAFRGVSHTPSHGSLSSPPGAWTSRCIGRTLRAALTISW